MNISGPYYKKVAGGKHGIQTKKTRHNKLYRTCRKIVSKIKFKKNLPEFTYFHFLFTRTYTLRNTNTCSKTTKIHKNKWNF